MLNLPKSTVVNRLISKEKLTRKLNLSPVLRESLKVDVRKVTVTNEISPKSMNIARGKSVCAVFIIEVLLKQKYIVYKLIEALGKQIGQKLVFVLRYDDVGQLALYRGKLYHSDWVDYANLTLDISGANLDEVWGDFIVKLALDGQFSQLAVSSEQLGVDELLREQERRKKLEREIGALEKKMRSEKQPRRKLELAEKLRKIKKDLETI